MIWTLAKMRLRDGGILPTFSSGCRPNGLKFRDILLHASAQNQKPSYNSFSIKLPCLIVSNKLSAKFVDARNSHG
jgi:hypothetical protein